MLAAFGGVLAPRLCQRRLRRCQYGIAKLVDRAKDFQSVPECNSEVFKVLIGQVGKD